MKHRYPSEPSTESKRVFVFGASGHAKVVIDILRLCGGVLIAGLLDDFKPIGFECTGIPVLGTLADLPALAAEHINTAIVIAVGDNWRRAKIAGNIRAILPQTSFVSAIHPSAQIAAGVPIGNGTVIMAGAVVNTGSQIGEFCIVNTRASLDHDSTMADYSSLCPGAITGGNVAVGAYSNVGMGAILLPEVKIGQHSVVGAGALVLKSIPDYMVSYGAPARLIHSRKPGDHYLTGSAPSFPEAPDAE
jgi:sugar O-acyltransferase (sialic acid O-acetyltransferase NeuD family)